MSAEADITLAADAALHISQSPVSGVIYWAMEIREINHRRCFKVRIKTRKQSSRMKETAAGCAALYKIYERKDLAHVSGSISYESVLYPGRDTLNCHERKGFLMCFSEKYLNTLAYKLLIYINEVSFKCASCSNQIKSIRHCWMFKPRATTDAVIADVTGLLCYSFRKSHHEHDIVQVCDRVLFLDGENHRLTVKL